MDTSTALRICALLLGFAVITNVVCAYSVAGVLSAKAIKYIAGVFLLLLTAYEIFYIIKSQKTLNQNIVLGVVAALLFAGSITCFAFSKYITQYEKANRFPIILFISLGIYTAAGLFWPILMLRFFSTIMQAFDADFLQLVSLVVSIVSGIIVALFDIIPSIKNENLFLKEVSLYTIAAVVINTVLTGVSGFFLQFRAESGYTSQL